MVQAPVKPISLQTFLGLSETKPASEYMDGQILQKSMPQGKHSTIQRDFTLAVESALKPSKIGRAFPELRCTFGAQSIVPDVAVFTYERIPRNTDGTIANRFNLAPDWIVEILSPDQSQTKVTKKNLHCLKHGTQLGWLVDPEEQTIFVHGSEKVLEVFDMHCPDTPLPIPSFAAEKVILTLKDVMDWLLD